MAEQEDQAGPNENNKNEHEGILTPLRTHYLKKTLINLQFGNELAGLTQLSPNPAISPFSYLGQPFTPPPKDAQVLDFPFMRYIFRQFVLTFPFLAAAPKDFFPQKVQPFLSSFLTRNLSVSSPFDEEAERTEQATREKILSRIQKQFGLLLGSASKLIEQEEVVRLTQKDLDRLETLAKRRNKRAANLKDSFDVNIVSIRTVTDKGRIRSKVHEEFLIRTRRSNRSDIFVSRRYGDFRTLSEELRKAYPDSVVPPPPSKDRSAVVAPLTSPSPTQSFGSVSVDHYEPENLSRMNTFDSVYSSEIPYVTSSAAHLAREKNRLTLRSYLHTLLSSSTFASSNVLRSFLTSEPTRLSPAEMEDARRREETDQVREDGRKRFAKELAVKVDGLRNAIKNVKGDVMGQDGLRHVFAIIKTNPDISSLPPDFKAVLEWARISLASTIFGHFVAADSASQSLATLKRTHGLMPYFMLKGILKISNPVSMIRSVLELFLAQPFGGRSLLQRMFTSSLAEEAKALQEDIEAVRDKIEDPILCEKVRLFVYAPTEIQTMFKADAEEEKLSLLTIVLRSSENPILSRAQLQRCFRAHRAHTEYKRQQEAFVDSDDDDGPHDDDAWLYEDLIILGKLYSKLRDREQLMELIFEGTTADLLKDIITIFYSPLAQVYKAASIADSLGDLQNFINDLIKTVEQVEVSQQDPANTVGVFVDLVQRHEQSFYHFVHKVHSKGAGLFDGLLRWIELFINLVREGLGDPISLEFLLPHTGPERINILREVDAVVLYHYRLKVAYENKVRRRFERGEASNNGTTTADEDDEATQALINDVVRDFSFGELVHADADDLVVDDSSEEESEEESETDESEEADDSDDSEEGQSVHIMSRSPFMTQRMPATTLNLHDRVRASMDNPPPPPPKPILRKRSLSFRSSKSSSDLRQGRRPAEAVPPVPSLPSKHIYSQLASPPVPPLSSRHNPPQLNLTAAAKVGSYPPQQLHRRQTTEDIRRGSVSSRSRPDTSMPPKVSKKKQVPDIKPPDLKAIPELLPLFVEMMRPGLRLRSV